jgi:hypothetical protein
MSSMFSSFREWASGGESPSSREPEMVHPQPTSAPSAGDVKKVVLERMVRTDEAPAAATTKYDKSDDHRSIISGVPSRASIYARGSMIEVPEAATEKDQMKYEEALQSWLEVPHRNGTRWAFFPDV